MQRHRATVREWAILVLLSSCTASRSFYVDPQGDDRNDGSSEATAWRTLDKLNATEFSPGDRILLRAGGTWSGELHPGGAGAEGDVITLTAYGDGPPPRIDGNGALPSTVYLEDQSHWTIRGLEITNCFAPCLPLSDPAVQRDRLSGVMIRATSKTPVRDVTIDNNAIHDVAGNYADVGGSSDNYYGHNAGIAFDADPEAGATFEDIGITRNSIHDVDRIGIFVGPTDQPGSYTADIIASLPRSKRVAILDNTVDHSGGDGILNYVTSNVEVAHNVVSNGGQRGTASVAIWTAASDGTTVEYNEVFGEVYGELGSLDRDRMAFDCDWGTTNHVVQYNYSHQNYGGFLQTWECSGMPGCTVTLNNITVRFNISFEDGADASTHVFTSCGTSLIAGSGLSIENNTVFVDGGRQTSMIGRCRASNSVGGPALIGAASVYNNIFYAEGTTSYAVLPQGAFDSNVYYAPAYAAGTRPTNEPSDASAQYGDPQLAAPATTGNGISSPTGMKLKPGSPALRSGRDIGIPTIHDYFGSALRAPFSRGACGDPNE